ncbi:hypothetical protein [Mesoterricola sediminis]|uniref:SH3 domain-containing protein n=1 Tax=Mesoterricola sediminis TaxID=2927980 RepID=A0AA48KGZ6_9BACT|nr:hypothetical protein [Mesoterricola sediminis]BDU77888.1 hypothetical protein METESE_28460 [Mesoterricola sediminis]
MAPHWLTSNRCVRAGAALLTLLLAAQGPAVFAADRDKDKKEEKREAPAPRQEAPRREAPRQEAPRREAPRQEAPRQEAPRREAPRQEAPRPEAPRQEAPRRDAPPTPRPEGRREEPPKPGTFVRQEHQADPARPETRKEETFRPVQPARPESPAAGRPAPRPDTPAPSTSPLRPAPGGRTETPNPAPPQVRPTPQPQTDRPAPGQPGRPEFRPAPDSRRDGSRPGPGRGGDRVVVHTPRGGEIHRTPTGAIREVRTPGGALIYHSPNGVRRVEVARPGGAVVIANATGRSGYIQRPWHYHGQTLIQRTYVFNGVARPRVYRPWSYGGRVYPIYVPVRHYRPAFYTWCYTPWSRPVTYRWGWYGRPWYTYYGGYWTPYPTYVSPAFWLTDFLIATTLEAAYLSQNATVSAPPVVYDTSTAMSPEVKEAIAEEVRRQMDQARAAQADDLGSEPPALFSKGGPRVFLVNADVMTYDGSRECPLSEGDVVQLVAPPAPGSEWAEVSILSSRGRCPRGCVVSIRTLDLQEMQNHMQAIVDQGLEKLQSERGGGLAPLPPQAFGSTAAPFSDDLRPDSDAVDELNRAVKDANSSEQEIIQESASAPRSNTITLGMTPAEVEAVLGKPQTRVELGTKLIYTYPDKDLKVTFLKGRVSDVQ